MKNKNLARIVFFSFCAVIFFVFLFRFPHSKDKNTADGSHTTVSVVMTKEGFTPSEITIRVGDSISFSSDAGKNFWPASDPHPTHDYVSGFDPGKELLPSDTWKFTFTTPGTWRYHDHIDLTHRGKVNVLGGDGQAVALARNADGYCDGKCFDEVIRKTVAHDGIDAAYKLFSKSFEEGKLPRSCHWTAHQIGEAAYELFREGTEFPISRATAYCGYGFYHGFLEGLLRENPDIDHVLAFCYRVKEELGNLGLWNCYHGIGHGFTEDPPDPKTWGNFQAMLDPGIKTCEFIFGKNFTNLNLCLTGVFTVPAGFAEHGEYGLSFDPKDPWAYCKDQPYRYHKACYGEFTPKLASDPNFTLDDLVPLLAKISDPKTRRLIVWVTPSVLLAKDILAEDFSSYILGCRNFSGKLRDICYGGVIQGFYSHGQPDKQYLAAYKYCESVVFTEEERNFCYAETLRQAQAQYDQKLALEVCASVDKKYQKYCVPGSHESPYDDPSFVDRDDSDYSLNVQ